MQSNEEGRLQNDSGTTWRINGRWETLDGIMASPRNSRHCGHGPGRSTHPLIGGSELNIGKEYVKKISPTRKSFERFSMLSNADGHSKGRGWSKIFGHSLSPQKRGKIARLIEAVS
jgi:hypothetical protein